MKTSLTGMMLRGAVAALVVAAAALPAQAQVWQATSQLSNMLSPILSGSGRYKGLVEVSGYAGVGDAKINHVEISTSQGYQYNSWFYMGAGIGVDIVHTPASDAPDTHGYYDPADGWNNNYYGRYGYKRTGVMLPVFTDFRFDIATGSAPTSPSVLIDLRLGASWLLGNRYMMTDHGYLSNQTQFYCRPSVGVRIPVGSASPRQAVSIGVSSLLLTSGNNYWYYGDSQTLSAFGASVSFEW